MNWEENTNNRKMDGFIAFFPDFPWIANARHDFQHTDAGRMAYWKVKMDQSGGDA